MQSIPDGEVYERLGDAGFARLIGAFYRRVRADDVIGTMYPPDDWEGAEERLRGFLIQRFGGPMTYSQNRGHPRLRMRHSPFVIGHAEATRWLELMRDAMAETGVEPDVAATIWPYFVSTAGQMMNRPG